MWIGRLAWLNLTRHARRTLLSVVAVVVGVAAMVIGKSFVSGLTENMVRAQIDSVSGHVTVRPADYPTQRMQHPVDDLFAVEPDLAAWLDAQGVIWTERLLFSPTIVARGDALRVRAIGYQPESDAAVLPRDMWRVDGALPEGDAMGIVLSRGVARLLSLEVGDVVTVRVRTPAGAINALAMPVAAVITTLNPYLDRLTVLMTKRSAEALLTTDGLSSHLVVRQPRRSALGAEQLADAIRTQLGEAQEVITWRDETRDIQHIQQIRQRGLDLLVFVLMGMSAAGIANTVLMAAYERTREVGTLRAMGMTKRVVQALFLVEGTMIGLAGGLLGTLAGGTVVAWFHAHGLDLSEPIEKATSGNMPVSAVLYPAFDLTWFVLAPTFGAMVSMVASVYPAHVAARLPPADAVRGG